MWSGTKWGTQQMLFFWAFAIMKCFFGCSGSSLPTQLVNIYIFRQLSNSRHQGLYPRMKDAKKTLKNFFPWTGSGGGDGGGGRKPGWFFFRSTCLALGSEQVRQLVILVMVMLMVMMTTMMMMILYWWWCWRWWLQCLDRGGGGLQTGAPHQQLAQHNPTTMVSSVTKCSLFTGSYMITTQKMITKQKNQYVQR